MDGAELYIKAYEQMSLKDIDTHESDLYLRVNEISKKLIAAYDFKNLVNTFIDNIDGVLWYDIPFCNYDYYN